MILVDTSAWIDLFGRRPRLKLTQERMMEIATCPPIVQEVLQGVRDDVTHAKLTEHMLALPCLGSPIVLDLFLEGAELYRAGRRRGLTIRSSVDCLIAAIALTHRASVWHVDRDFDALARFTDLRTFTGRALT